MMQHISNNGTAFGGSWTVEKLEILEKILGCVHYGTQESILQAHIHRRIRRRRDNQSS